MRVHVIQHVTFEGPGLIAEWAVERGHELTSSLALTEEYPDCKSIGLICVMGGPMDADDEGASPWLHAEKHYLAECISGGNAVLGICLGAQILAEVLGGRVKRGEHKEIGWYPVTKTDAGRRERLVSAWPDSFVVGQWHGDTFDLPAGLKPLMSSETFANQAFVFDGRVVGVQFHLEWTEESLGTLIAACPGDFEDHGPWVSSPVLMQDEAEGRVPDDRALLFAVLDALAERVMRGNTAR
jgi:GMP synthase-like glutamine amidotransferase